MFAVVLYEPEIAPNTGNVLRLASNSGARLHLVRPLGFSLRDRQLGAPVSITAILATSPFTPTGRHAANISPGSGYSLSRREARAVRRGCVSARRRILFGPETRGLPQEVLDEFMPEQRIPIPMREGNRSMNLANAVAVVVYEAWRRQDFREG